MYRTRQAAKYVGMNFNTFVYHVVNGHIREKGRIKGERVFEQSQLDAFKNKYMSAAGMTKEDICSVYEQEEGVVRGHLRRKKIKPIAKNGKSFMYDPRTIRNMAIQLGWIDGDVEGEVDDVGSVGDDDLDLGGRSLSKALVSDDE